MGDFDESKQVYDAIAHQIDREDKLAFSRARILLAIVGAQFALLAGLWKAATLETELGPEKIIIFIAGVAGFLISDAIRVGIGAAYKQIEYLQKSYHANNEIRNFERSGLPRPFGDEKAHKRGEDSLSMVPWIGYSLSLAMIVAPFFAPILTILGVDL